MAAAFQVNTEKSSEYGENQTEWDFALLKEAGTNLGNQKEQSRERKRTRKMVTGSRKRGKTEWKIHPSREAT